MNSETFNSIYEKWSKKTKGEPFWNDDLAKKNGYSSAEALRSAFRRYRKYDFQEEKNVSVSKSAFNSKKRNGRGI